MVGRPVDPPPEVNLQPVYLIAAEIYLITMAWEKNPFIIGLKIYNIVKFGGGRTTGWSPSWSKPTADLLNRRQNSQKISTFHRQQRPILKSFRGHKAVNFSEQPSYEVIYFIKNCSE